MLAGLLVALGKAQELFPNSFPPNQFTDHAHRKAMLFLDLLVVQLGHGVHHHAYTLISSCQLDHRTSTPQITAFAFLEKSRAAKLHQLLLGKLGPFLKLGIHGLKNVLAGVGQAVFLLGFNTSQLIHQRQELGIGHLPLMSVRGLAVEPGQDALEQARQDACRVIVFKYLFSCLGWGLQQLVEPFMGQTKGCKSSQVVLLVTVLPCRVHLEHEVSKTLCFGFFQHCSLCPVTSKEILA